MAQVIMPNPPKEGDGVPKGVQYHADPPAERKPVQAIRRKQSLSSRIASFLFNEEIDNVWAYITHDILVPAIQDTLTSMISNGADMLFRGKRGGYGQGYSGSSNPYVRSSIAAQPSSGYSYRTTQNQPIRGRSFKDYYFRNEAEARYVLDQLDILASEYGFASVDDYYQLIGVSGTHVDTKWGWVSMANARIRRDRDGWVIDFEEAMPKR